jgi:hypothetical protein
MIELAAQKHFPNFGCFQFIYFQTKVEICYGNLNKQILIFHQENF